MIIVSSDIIYCGEYGTSLYDNLSGSTRCMSCTFLFLVAIVILWCNYSTRHRLHVLHIFVIILLFSWLLGHLKNQGNTILQSTCLQLVSSILFTRIIYFCNWTVSSLQSFLLFQFHWTVSLQYWMQISTLFPLHTTGSNMDLYVSFRYWHLHKLIIDKIVSVITYHQFYMEV